MSKVTPDVIAKIMAIDAEKRSTIPLRLAVAAQVAFPDGSMGAAGLRKERDKGRLVTEMIAGKEYTTLAAIQRMRKLCRVQPKLSQPQPDTDVALAAARARLNALRQQTAPREKRAVEVNESAVVVADYLPRKYSLRKKK